MTQEEISKDYILKCNQNHQNLFIELEQLRSIYNLFDKPKAKAVFENKIAYISFEDLNNMQFILKKIKTYDQFLFIDPCEKIFLDLGNQSFSKFIICEFWQGDNFINKTFRFITTILPILFFNFFIILFATQTSINNTFSGLLTAVSIFVAIFSVFTINHEHLERKKMELFKRGRLSYFFSVDRNITIMGIISIITSILGILITQEDPARFITFSFEFISLKQISVIKLLILLLLNSTFFSAYVVLRSIVEFYIHRPARFIIGEMKDNFLHTNQD